MTHVIGTYNMSFMSDLNTEIGPKMAFASEGAFLARLYGKPEERRSYWINAMNLLKQFLEEKEPSVVGLQEMNLTSEGAGSGTDAINTMLKGLNAKVGPYMQISHNVPTNNAGLSIIYNPQKIGNLIHSECIDNPNQGGRPLLMVITEKGGKKYLSISIHGAQDPKLRLDKEAFDTYMIEKNKDFVQSAANTFLETQGINSATLDGIFIMGDFNDRYDAIKDITIAGKTATYTGPAPKSCCYNWDSSCPDGDVEKDFGNGYKTCNVPAVQTNDKGKLTLGDRGAIKNYKYAGDKVFGLNPKTPMAMYRPAEFGKDGISTESDHEFVYATVGEATTGGKRRSNKKTRHHKKSVKKSKTRKHYRR